MINGQIYPDEIVIEVLKEYKKGKTSPELCQKYSIGAGTIDHWAKMAGIKRKINRKRESWVKIKEALQ